MQCVTADWLATLDDEDREAFKRAVGRMSRVDLYGAICTAHGSRPFGLTALKQHVLNQCCCN